MNAAWLSAVAEAVTATAVLAAAVTWVVNSINSAISRSAFRAARQEAEAIFRKADDRSRENFARVEKALQAQQRRELAVLAVCLASCFLFAVEVVIRRARE